MDKKKAFADKYDEVLKPTTYYGHSDGRVIVAPWNLNHLSALLHASAMKHMNIASEREEQLFLGCAYQGESGELGNVIKKIARDGVSRELLEKLKGEIADNYLYLQHICELFEIEPTSAIAAKTDELYNVRQPEWAKEAIVNAGGAYVRQGDEVDARPRID